MKKYNVLLLGDSIRLGYQEYVKNELKDIADVYAPNDNGRFCQNLLAFFHIWAMILSDGWKYDFDVIFFNSGLWDILRLSNEEECFNSPDNYKELLERIVHRIKYFYPKAKIVFALTTKVQEPGYKYGCNVGIRKNSDVKKYNLIAIELLNKMGVDIVDLYNVSLKLDNDAMSDNVHYDTSKGNKALGGEVSRVIRKICQEL